LWGWEDLAMLGIRRYHPSDHDDVWALHNEALGPTGAHLGNGPWDEDLHHVEETYLSDGGEFLVGILDGRVVAMGALKKTSDQRAEVKRMRVHPSVQRRGYGQRILSALEDRARALGYRTLHLDTTTRQQAARRFYETNGYVKVGRKEVGGLVCVVYEKRIGAGEARDR
jgi:ribosomal protein S18 acetylase RimI-like enzyme